MAATMHPPHVHAPPAYVRTRRVLDLSLGRPYCWGGAHSYSNAVASCLDCSGEGSLVRFSGLYRGPIITTRSADAYSRPATGRLRHAIVQWGLNRSRSHMVVRVLAFARAGRHRWRTYWRVYNAPHSGARVRLGAFGSFEWRVPHGLENLRFQRVRVRKHRHRRRRHGPHKAVRPERPRVVAATVPLGPADPCRWHGKIVLSCTSQPSRG